MRVLITGAGGQLGRELAATAPRSHDVTAATRAELDLTDREAIDRAVGAGAADVIINAAAYTAVDRAEQEPDAAHATNVEGAERLALAAKASGARLIHLSTDYVFDGSSRRPYRPDDDALPLSVYGRTKLEGERRVLQELGDRALVLRSAWLHSRHRGNFVQTILARMRDGAALRVVDDQVGAPTAARGLAEVIWRAVDSPAFHGVHHWTDAGSASWYELALAIGDIARRAGLLERVPPITPVTAAAYGAPARRPAYSVLDCSSTVERLGVSQSSWRSMLERSVLS